MVCGHQNGQAHVQTESSKVDKALPSDIADIANFLPSRAGTFQIYTKSQLCFSGSL